MNVLIGLLLFAGIAGSVWGLIRTIRRPVALVVDATGICIESWSDEPIFWSEIAAMSFRTYRKYFDRGRSYDVPCLCLKLVTLDRFPPTGKVRAHASICAKTGFGDVAIELDSLGRRNFARIIGAIRRFSPDNGAMLDAAVVPDSI